MDVTENAGYLIQMASNEDLYIYKLKCVGIMMSN